MSMNIRSAAMVVLLAACHQGTIVADERQAPPREVAPRNDAGIARPEARADAGAIPATSGFAVVARVQGGAPISLVRPSGGPVLAFANEPSALWQLDAATGPRIVKSFVERVSSTESFFMRLSSVAGRWPSLHVELAIPGARAASIFHTWTVDVEKGTGERAQNGRIVASSPWIDGTELGWAPQYEEAPGGGRFVILAGAAKPLPKVPKAVWGFSSGFAAYPSGRIFLVSGMKKGDELTEPVVWVWDATEAKPVVLPGQRIVLARGRREEETLVHGVGDDRKTWLKRWDGSTFVDVAWPSDVPIQKIAVGDNGSVWILTEAVRPKPRPGAERGPSRAAELWRASFPDLRPTQMALPSDVSVDELAVTNERDVWLAGTRGSSSSNERESLLLHSQAAPEKLMELPNDAEDLARLALAGREPSPFGPACRMPFVVLGPESAAPESDAEAFATSWNEPTPEAQARAVTVRAPSGDRLVGLELQGAWLYGSRLDAKMTASIKKALTAAQKKWPSAKLVCTRLPLAGAK